MRRILGALAVAAGVGLALLALHLLRRPPAGPVPVAWDRTPCARCHMLVGEPAFAAQLQTRDGEVLDFDDPGCLLLYEHEYRPEVHARWFHHLEEDRWLNGTEAVFVEAGPTPMGYGLGVVAVGEGLSLEEARARVLAREAARRGD
jgi:copper chaperone NosL